MKQKILIVEDEPAIMENICYALETDGFQTLSLYEGEKVMNVLENERIDLVILDIGLPDINGMELCKRIRKSCSVPVMFLTARSQEVDRVVGLEIGADDYVVKPFSPREVSARVKAILRRTAGTVAAEKNNLTAFHIDESRRQITFHGQILELSRYEYEILKILIRRAGHVLTRDMIMEMVWDDPYASMDRTVDAHIKNIRAKLRRVYPHNDPITTHRGIGYSLKEDI